MAIGIYVIYDFSNSLDHKQWQVEELMMENQNLNIHINSLKKDSVKQKDKNNFLLYSLNSVQDSLNDFRIIMDSVQDSLNNFRIIIRQMDKQLNKNEGKFFQLKSQDDDLISISNVSIASANNNGDLTSYFGDVIYSIKISMAYSYKVPFDTYKNLNVKLYGCVMNSSEYRLCATYSERVYMNYYDQYFRNYKNYEFKNKLSYKGNRFPVGNYYVEISSDGDVLFRHYFSIF